ncbi:MAG: hypothetical protein ACTH29_00620 [Fusobacterium sp.]
MKYYINKKTQEVFKESCGEGNNPEMVLLGEFEYSGEAVEAAKAKGYPEASGVAYDSVACHTKD